MLQRQRPRSLSGQRERRPLFSDPGPDLKTMDRVRPGRREPDARFQYLCHLRRCQWLQRDPVTAPGQWTVRTGLQSRCAGLSGGGIRDRGWSHDGECAMYALSPPVPRPLLGLPSPLTWRLGIGSGCNRWATGEMDLTSSATTWIWAYKNGSPLRSDSPSASLDQHDAMDDFRFNLAEATGGNSLNPFAAQAAVRPDPSGSTGGSSDIENEIRIARRAKIAHGTIMGLAFVIVYPLGAIIIRLLSFTGLIWVHAATQGFAYLMALTGLGLGVYIALKPNRQVCHPHRVGGARVVSGPEKPPLTMIRLD